MKKFTHVLNVAEGKGRFHCNTGPAMYSKVGIQYMGKCFDCFTNAIFKLHAVVEIIYYLLG